MVSLVNENEESKVISFKTFIFFASQFGVSIFHYSHVKHDERDRVKRRHTSARSKNERALTQNKRTQYSHAAGDYFSK